MMMMMKESTGIYWTLVIAIQTTRVGFSLMLQLATDIPGYRTQKRYAPPVPQEQSGRHPRPLNELLDVCYCL
jgi:hypothetical protein